MSKDYYISKLGGAGEQFGGCYGFLTGSSEEREFFGIMEIRIGLDKE